MKLKTNKALKKRLKITKNNKVVIRRGKQNHFNAKASGKVTRRKRSDKLAVPALVNAMKVVKKMPYKVK